MVQAYILVLTEVGRAADVVSETGAIDGVLQAEHVTGPYDVVVRAEAADIDALGQLVVARIQGLDGISRTLTCPVLKFHCATNRPRSSSNTPYHSFLDVRCIHSQ